MTDPKNILPQACDVPLNKESAHLVDFVDLDILQRFQDRFARAIGVSAVIRDPDGHMVTRPSIPNSFCSLVNSGARGLEHCKNSSVALTLQAVTSGQVAEDVCPVGFHRFAAPIKMGDLTLGAMVIGEIMEGPADEAHITAVALDLGLNPGDLLEASQEIKLRSPAEVSLSVDFAQFAASILAQLCYEGSRLRRQLQAMQTVRGSGELFDSPLDLAEVLQTIVRVVQHQLRVKAVGLRLLDDAGQLVVKANVGLSENYLRKGPVHLSASRVDQDAMQSGTIYIRDVRTDARVLYPHEMEDEGIGSALIVPLKVKERPIGVLRIYAAANHVFDETDFQLAEVIAAQSAIAIENAHLYQEALAKERLEAELDLASRVQTHLLPDSPPNLHGLDVAAVSLPCRVVGGDFYDFLKLSDTQTGIVIADVCGKSIGAALLMASTRSSLRVHAEHPMTPADLVTHLNHSLIRGTHPEEFVTLVYGILDTDRHTLTYTNAGHNPPLLYRHHNLIQLRTGGVVCGVIEPAVYEQETIQLLPGDTLLLYTDGLNEARNADNEMFGLDRLHRLIHEYHHESAENLIQHIVGAVQQFSRPREQSDDLTLLLIKVSGGPPKTNS